MYLLRTRQWLRDAVGVTNCGIRRARKWRSAVRHVYTDSDDVVITNCYRNWRVSTTAASNTILWQLSRCSLITFGPFDSSCILKRYFPRHDIVITSTNVFRSRCIQLISMLNARTACQLVAITSSIFNPPAAAVASLGPRWRHASWR